MKLAPVILSLGLLFPAGLLSQEPQIVFDASRPGGLPASAFDGSIIRLENDLVYVHSGEIIFEPSELTMLGPSNATHLVAGIVDYTCDHCRKMYRNLSGIQENYGQDLAAVFLPGIKARGESEAVHLLLFTARQTDKGLYDQLATEVLYEQFPAREDKIRDRLAQAWGEEELADRLAEHKDASSDIIERVLKVIAINHLRLNQLPLPQLMLGNFVTGGVPEDGLEYYPLLKKHLGLDPRYPVLGSLPPSTSLGKVFAGSTLSLSIPLENRGNATLFLGKASIPEGSTVTSRPVHGVPPGETIPLSFSFTVPERPGPIEWPIKVTCNTYPSTASIMLKAEVWAPVLFDPPEAVLNKEKDETVTVRITTDTRVVFGKPESSPVGLEIDMQVLEEGSRYELHVKPGDAASGSGSVRIPIVSAEPGHPWPEFFSLPFRLD